MRSLAKIYGTWSFKYPGGVEINFDMYKSDAQDEIDKIEEWVNNQHAADYFFQPNTM